MSNIPARRHDYHRLTRQKRGAIYAAITEWPPGLNRIVAEYAISAGELIEEYVLCTYDVIPYQRYPIWGRDHYRINIVWRGENQHYSLNFQVTERLGSYECKCSEWVNNFNENDLIGAIEKTLIDPKLCEVALGAIRMMVDSMMKSNISA